MQIETLRLRNVNRLVDFVYNSKSVVLRCYQESFKHEKKWFERKNIKPLTWIEEPSEYGP